MVQTKNKQDEKDEKETRRAVLLQFCRELPHVTEDIKWGNDLIFSIGGKMFAGFDARAGDQFGFKATPEEFDFLTSRPGIIPAPYAARFFWVSVQTSDAIPLENAKKYLKESYQLVASKLPKKVQRELGFLPTK